MKTNQKKGCTRSILTVFAAFAGLCLLLAALSAGLNATRPTHSRVIDRLSVEDKSRLAEINHLRQVRGDAVLPGWAQANIPLITYNEEYLFLTGCPDPADGWRTVPQGTFMGQAWQVVPNDNFDGQPYYRQALPAPGVNTQAFTVQVGDCWAASLSTYEWMRISMDEELRGQLPAALQPVLPVGLMVNLLIPGSDAYVTLMLHEAVHAYQGIRAPERLNAAEQASRQNSDQYPWEDETFQQAWQAELDTLHQAVRAANAADTLPLARAFLQQRAQRRAAADLPPNLINYERQREWEEGIAKYGERAIFLQAAAADYQPLPASAQDPEFQQYRGAQQKWDQEVDQIRRMASAVGDGRFYYTGFAQAVLLDRLAPGWKEPLFSENARLEDFLTEAVK